MKITKEKGQLKDSLVTQLSQELRGCNIQDITALVQLALYDHADASFETTVRHFLGAGAHAGKVLATLLRCEWSNIHWLLIDSRKRDQSLSDQVAAFSDCVGHYTLRAVIIEEAESAWEASLESEKTARVLAECKLKWLHEHEIELHNYFQEIPVRAKLELLDIADDVMDVKFSTDAGMVFAASDDLKTAYISAGDCMRLTINGVERRGNRLRLVIAGVESDLMSRRKNVRVSLDKVVPITLHGRTKIQAHIYDKSVKGLGVLFPASIGVKLINGGDLKTGDRITCIWQPGEVEFKAPAIVRWIKQLGDDCRAGLEITPDEATRRHLQQFLMQSQRRIISRLRKLDLPSWMTQ